MIYVAAPLFLDRISHADISVTATNWDMYDTYELTQQLEEAKDAEKHGMIYSLARRPW